MALYFTPEWGDIPAKRWRIHPRAEPVGFCCRGNPVETQCILLTQEEIPACLRQLADREDYADIQQTTTSIGTVYLYSTLHLNRDYASMLAEWLDVGQFNNP